MHLKSTKKLSFKAAKVAKSFTSGNLIRVVGLIIRSPLIQFKVYFSIKKIIFVFLRNVIFPFHLHSQQRPLFHFVFYLFFQFAVADIQFLHRGSIGG